MQGGPEGQQENETRDKKQAHSSPFKEPVNDQRSTTNPEQEADLEQQRKEALTERD